MQDMRNAAKKVTRKLKRILRVKQKYQEKGVCICALKM